MFNFLENTPILGFFLALYLGLACGSFATAIIYRTRHGQSWVWNKSQNNQSANQARSFCPSCRHSLSFLDLIPVFSWLWQRGKCRYCRTDIPKSYIATELSIMLISIAIWFFVKGAIIGYFYILLTPFVVAQFVLACKYKIISKSLISIILIGGAISLVLIY